MSLVPIRVRTYSGYRGEQRPTAFEYEGRWIEVEELLDEALELRAERLWRRFRIRAEGRVFILWRQEQRGQWMLDEV